jgi:hypothetical protein
MDCKRYKTCSMNCIFPKQPPGSTFSTTRSPTCRRVQTCLLQSIRICRPPTYTRVLTCLLQSIRICLDSLLLVLTLLSRHALRQQARLTHIISPHSFSSLWVFPHSPRCVCLCLSLPFFLPIPLQSLLSLLSLLYQLPHFAVCLDKDIDTNTYLSFHFITRQLLLSALSLSTFFISPSSLLSQDLNSSFLATPSFTL